MASLNGFNFPKNFRKKSDRGQNKDLNSQNGVIHQNFITFACEEPLDSTEYPANLNIKKRRPRRHKNHKSQNGSNRDSPVVNVKENMFNPSNDVLGLQELYFKMKGLKVPENDSNTSDPQVQPDPQISKSQSSPRKLKPASKSKVKEEKQTYENYLSREEVLIGLQNKTVFEGSLRINPKFSKHAYVSSPNKQEKDIFINGVLDRNRALEGDMVVIELNDPVEGEERSGKVVHITEEVHPRTCVGHLTLNGCGNTGATFQPRDKRLPYLNIPLIDCPPNFVKEHEGLAKTLFFAKVVTWVNTKLVIGTLLAVLGKSNDMKVQTKSILLENCLDVRPFGSEFKHLYPEIDLAIPEEEFSYREDFRNHCVFTIDPLTARDLDDAVSCKILPNGNYEIGVHISDVSYYLKEGNALDDLVAKKATTIYLVDETYHMLPRDLCLHCSLLPGLDKLCFSVIWEFSNRGEILNHRLSRSIINSCCQLAYDHVQTILENPDKVFKEKEFPSIVGPWTLEEVKNIVLTLYKFSVKLRSKRVEGGALRIDQPKLIFNLSPKTGFPLAFKIEEHNESHRLIEEFMLLANCAVAKRINDDFPDLAFLRLHPPPKNSIKGVAENLTKMGVSLNISSSAMLQKSIAEFSGNDFFSNAKALVLHTHLIKTLSRALYFCIFGRNEDEIRHYSLNIPLYTHFTSPIRRYADVIVHRLLSASLGYTPKPQWNYQYVQRVADNCNMQKYNAKKAGDMSSDLYLLKYVSINSPLFETAAIVDVCESGIDIIILSMGFVTRIYYDKFSDDVNSVEYLKSDKGEPSKVRAQWPGSIHILQMFSIVTVKLEKTKDLMIMKVRIVKP